MTTGFALIASERLALADLLETLSEPQWATASLCRPWTVKDVAAHLTVGPTTSVRTFLVEMLKARGDFDRVNLALVRRLEPLTSHQVVERVRSIADSRFTPPTFDWHAPYADLRLHTLDMLVPLGLEDPYPALGWAHVLDLLVSPQATRGFVAPGRPALSASATDVDWSHTVEGAPEVSGPGRALGSVLSGRTAYAEELAGPGVAALVAWAQRVSGR